MAKQKVTITLERNLVEKIDEDRGLIPRSAYIEKLLRETMKNKSPQNPPIPLQSSPDPPRPDHTRPYPPKPNL